MSADLTRYGGKEWNSPAEPIEIRLGSERLRERYLITAWCTQQGTIAHSMVDQDRRSCSLANLQPKLHFPGKAVRRWQREFIDAAASGLYTIEEIR